MQYRITKTTDGKYEGVEVERDEPFNPGDIVSYGEVSFKLEKIMPLDEKRFKLVSTNYQVVVKRLAE